MPKQFLTMSKKWTLDSNRNWVNSGSEKAGIVTESSWYNGKASLFTHKFTWPPVLGGNIMRVRAYKENEKVISKKSIAAKLPQTVFVQSSFGQVSKAMGLTN